MRGTSFHRKRLRISQSIRPGQVDYACHLQRGIFPRSVLQTGNNFSQLQSELSLGIPNTRNDRICHGFSSSSTRIVCFVLLANDKHGKEHEEFTASCASKLCTVPVKLNSASKWRIKFPSGGKQVFPAGLFLHACFPLSIYLFFCKVTSETQGFRLADIFSYRKKSIDLPLCVNRGLIQKFKINLRVFKYSTLSYILLI